MTNLRSSNTKPALFQRGTEMGATAEFLDIIMLSRMLGVSRSTIYNWRNAQLLPPPIRLGPNRVSWRRGDIEKWSASREAA